MEVTGKYLINEFAPEAFVRYEESPTRLVAKESRNTGPDMHLETLEYVQDFVRTQSRAGTLASEFVKVLDGDASLADVPRLHYLEAFTFKFGNRTILVEEFIVERYKKWILNVGRGEKNKGKGGLEKYKERLEAKNPAMPLKASPAINRGTMFSLGHIIEEGDEDEEDSSSDESDDTTRAPSAPTTGNDNREPEDVLSTFMHWTYLHTGKVELVCDIQGGFSESSNLFHLTDPAIHHSSKKNKRGRTDHGNKGIRSVMDAHQCNWLCRHLHLPEYFELKGRKIVFLAEDLDQQRKKDTRYRESYLTTEVTVRVKCKELGAKYVEGGEPTEGITDYVVVSKAVPASEQNPCYRYIHLHDFNTFHRKEMEALKVAQSEKDERNFVAGIAEKRQHLIRQISDLLLLTNITDMDDAEKCRFREWLVRVTAEAVPGLLERLLLEHRFKKLRKADEGLEFEKWVESTESRVREIEEAWKDVLGDSYNPKVAPKKIHEGQSVEGTRWRKCTDPKDKESWPFFVHELTGEKTDIPPAELPRDEGVLDSLRGATIDNWTLYEVRRKKKLEEEVKRFGKGQAKGQAKFDIEVVAYYRNEKTNARTTEQPRGFRAAFRGKDEQKVKRTLAKAENSKGPEKGRTLVVEFTEKCVFARGAVTKRDLFVTLLQRVKDTLERNNSAENAAVHKANKQAKEKMEREKRNIAAKQAKKRQERLKQEKELTKQLELTEKREKMEKRLRDKKEEEATKKLEKWKGKHYKGQLKADNKQLCFCSVEKYLDDTAKLYKNCCYGKEKPGMVETIKKNVVDYLLPQKRLVAELQQKPITLQDLDEATQSDRRNIIAKSLFPLVLASPRIKLDRKEATMITNMLMNQMDNKSIIRVLCFPEILNSSIKDIFQAAEREERAQRAGDLDWFGGID